MWKNTEKKIDIRVFEHVESEEPEDLSSFLETLLGKCPQNQEGQLKYCIWVKIWTISVQSALAEFF